MNLFAEVNLDKTQEYVDFIKTNLEPLAKYLKVSIEWLWHIIVQQARVEAITYIVVGIVLSLVSIGLFMFGMKTLKRMSYQEDETEYNYEKHAAVKTGRKVTKYASGIELAVIPLIASGIIMAANVTTFVINAPVVVTGLVNPEYRAIEKIVEFAHNNKEEVKSTVKETR